eukprot:3931691-Rhodomonas_salina.1
MGVVDLLGHWPKCTWTQGMPIAGLRADRLGVALFYNNSLPISWRSARQPLVTLSTAESKYVQATLACQEVVALRHLFTKLGFPKGSAYSHLRGQQSSN